MAPVSPAAVRRTLLRDLGTGVAQTAHAHLTPAEVHATRKHIKRARATLALLRPALRERDYRACDRALRDAGRRLAPARDAAVVARTYARMRALTQGLAPLAPERRPAWLGRHARPRTEEDAAAAHGHLRAAAERLSRARLTGRGWAPLGSGVRAAYRRGRRRRPTVSDPTTEALHAWRRHAKRYWHVLDLFEDVNPRRIAPAVIDAHRLSDLLGEEHDLALLADKLAPSRRREDKAVLATVAERRARLTARALKLGAKVYDEPARAVERRLRSDWERWRGRSRS